MRELSFPTDLGPSIPLITSPPLFLHWGFLPWRGNFKTMDSQFESYLQHFLVVWSQPFYLMFLDFNPHPPFKVTTDAFNFSHQFYGNSTSTWQPLFLYFYFIQMPSCSSTTCWKDDLFRNWFNLALAPFSKINWLYVWWVYFWTRSCSIDLLGYSYVNSTVLTSVAIFKCYKIFLKLGNKGPSMFFFKKNNYNWKFSYSLTNYNLNAP